MSKQRAAVLIKESTDYEGGEKGNEEVTSFWVDSDATMIPGTKSGNAVKFRAMAEEALKTYEADGIDLNEDAKDFDREVFLKEMTDDLNADIDFGHIVDEWRIHVMVLCD